MPDKDIPSRGQATLGVLCIAGAVGLALYHGIIGIAITVLLVVGVLFLFPTRPLTLGHDILGKLGVGVSPPASDGYQYDDCPVDSRLRSRDEDRIWLEVTNTGVRDEFCCKIVEFADRNEPTLPWVLKWQSWAQEFRPLAKDETKKILIGKLGEDPGTPGLRREGPGGKEVEVRHGRMTFYPHNKNDEHLFLNAYRTHRDEVRVRVEISSKKAREPYTFWFRARLKSMEDPQPSVSITSNLS